jgi:hypothetical protein
LVQAFPVLGQTATSVEPSDGSLNDPAFGQDGKGLRIVGPLDDFHVHLPQDTFHGTLKLWPLVTTVGIELQQE